MLHRDLKPSNILVRESDMQPVVLDFGNAYIIDDLTGDSLTTSAVGSMGYVPPEVFANPRLRSTAHDVYAVAAITYELIARRLPDPLNYRPLSMDFGTPSSLDAVLSRALGAAHLRHESALAMRDELMPVCWPHGW